jgi:hypothetical protein
MTPVFVNLGSRTNAAETDKMVGQLAAAENVVLVNSGSAEIGSGASARITPRSTRPPPTGGRER